MKTINLFLAVMLSLVFLSCNNSVAATDLDFNTEMSDDQTLQTIEFISDSTLILAASSSCLGS